MEKKYGAVSADSHLRLPYLPFDLWTKRLPAKFKDQAPHVETTPEGRRRWVVEGKPWSGIGANPGASTVYSRVGINEEPEPGIFRPSTAKYRCEDLDRDQVDGEMINGPYESLNSIQNEELRAACTTVVNEWAKELYDESNGRLIMLAPVSTVTAEEAVAEIYRVAKIGMPTGIVFGWPRAPQPIWHEMWEPVWAAAAETGLPVNFHAGGGGSPQGAVPLGELGYEGGNLTTQYPRNLDLVHATCFTIGPLAEILASLVLTGICDRHPKANFIIEEPGVGWAPYMSWRMDREYFMSDNEEPPEYVFHRDYALSDKPSEFVKRQVRFTFELEEEGGFKRIPEVGMKNFLWATDFPGRDSPWPNSRAQGLDVVDRALGVEARKQLSFDNVVGLYRIPVTEPAAAR